MDEGAPGATVDVDWSLLDAQLADSVVSFLADAFTTAPRPSYLGDISVTSFSFGDTQPEVTVLDIRDIYKEFFDVDDEERLAEPVPPSRPAPPLHRTSSGEPRDDQRARPGPTGAGLGTSSSFGDFRELAASMNRKPRPSSSLFSPGLHGSYAIPSYSPYHSSTPPPETGEHTPDLAPSAPSIISSFTPDTAQASSSSAPSLQLHLRVAYSGNLNIGFSTSLLINYPSPRFMSLPLKLCLTSLDFTGTFLIAFEGDRRRVHLALMDPKDEPIPLSPFPKDAFTAGARLLTGAVVESEVGQSDKHVLKNVGKVEKFVLDVVRSTLESELVFPNFQTVLF